MGEARGDGSTEARGVDWQVVGGAGDTGQVTEVGETPFIMDVREVQVLN
jgi:hypothetical protein